MSKAKKVATTLKTILENPIMVNILDRTKDILPIVEEVNSWWRYDMFSRRPGIAYDPDDGTKTTDLDLSCFLFELAERHAVINIPEYTSMRATKLKEGQALISKENRHGQVLGLVANKETFSFSLRIKDANVVTSESVADYRNFSCTDLEGNWHEGWSDLQFIENVEENKFLTENKLTDGNKIHFNEFVHPNRWISFYGQYYFISKTLISRLIEEAKYYNIEIKAMLAEGIKYPGGGDVATEWPKSEKIPGKKIKVNSFEVEIDVPENNTKYPTYAHTQENLVELTNRRKYIVYTLTPKLTFATRTVEFAMYKFGKDKDGNDKMPVWLENVKWEKDYIQKGKRTKWERLNLFQNKVGEVGVSIRKRIYETSQEVSETYYAARAGKVKNEIVVILDESGSMGTIKEPIINLFNLQVDNIKANSNDGVESHVSLVTFSSTVKRPLLWRQSSEELNKLDSKSFNPSGLTALYDAIGKTADAYQRSKLDEDTNYLFVILTDGFENNSSEYRTSQAIGDLIERLQNTGKWTFTYMGANQDLNEVQAALRINKGNITEFKANDEGVKKASFTVSRGLNAYYGSTLRGDTSMSNFYDTGDDKTKK